MKNNLQNNKALEKKIDWENIKKQMREKFGNDIYESWIKKIELVEEFHNYILFSVFIYSCLRIGEYELQHLFHL